eukprot:TRINITY_DN64897_c0_g1_i1.p1 TRINITY_DN64897_c0_g1~~TRINITY_DN64897_c0_g1_i1.p1  ORF type:complete len:153 (+),score=20.48 TRINITY_DN64897_c0_g1_i1:134-592(+)
MVDSVTLVRCEKCGGGLRPHVVLFGENVPAPRVADCFEAVRSCSVLLCMGTSLKVYSAYRFVKFAKENGTPVVIINNGPTRGDGDADIKVETESVAQFVTCLLYTSDAADEEDSVDLGGRRIIKKKNINKTEAGMYVLSILVKQRETHNTSI